MVCPRQVALPGVALLILAIIKKKNSSSKEKDIISQLPDYILKSIVRCLPTRDAARTSILSKSWRNIQTFVPHMLGLKPKGPLHYDHLLGFKECVISGVNTLLRAFFGFEIDTPRPIVFDYSLWSPTPTPTKKEEGAMLCSRNLALSCVALSGIVISKIMKKQNSRPRAKNIISQLPDDPLVSILERLSARDAARTSVLSKRWKNLYSFVPHVDFDCLHMLGLEPEGSLHHDNSRGFKKIVKNGVNTYVVLRKISTPRVLQRRFIYGVDTFLWRHFGFRIVSCNLACCFSTSYPGKLQQWIHSLGRLGVEQLTLKFMCTPFTIPYYYEVPPPFSCQTISEAPSLQFLTLVRCTLQADLKNQCKNLKTLHLDKVTIPAGAMECLLSNCLNLESLKIVYCVVHGNKLCFRGPNLQLKDLIVFGCYGINKMELYASNLTTFKYFGFRLVEFSFDHVPQLEKFSIRLRGEYILRMLNAELAIAFKSLILGGNYPDMHIPIGFNMFSNLRRLDLEFFMVLGDEISVASVLDLCPLLQEFNFVASHADPMQNSGCYASRTRSIEFHTQLKKVGFSGFSGTTFETNFAIYILRSAIVLEQMHISLYYTYELEGEWKTCHVQWDEDRCERMHQLFLAQNVSKRAKITISHKTVGGNNNYET